MNKNGNKNGDKRKSGYFRFLFVFLIFTMLVSTFVPWYIYFENPNEISKFLKEFAVINITIAIGLIAATIAIKESNQKDDLMYLGLLQITVGVMSYFLGLWNIELLSTLYLMLNGVGTVASLTNFLRNYENV